MQRDSIANTFLVATSLCVVCSVLVSSASVGLRPLQEANKVRERQRNILKAAGLYDSSQPLDELYEQVIEPRLVDLETGEYADESVVDPESFDQRSAAKDPALSVELASDSGLSGFKRREKYSFVYLVRDDQGELEQVVLPVYGKGLWSTCYGFVALEGDLQTIRGITFYEHGETPGLGGEIENPAWTDKWKDKQAFCEDKPCIEVIRGAVDPNSSAASHQVDGIAGATITSRGVSNLVRYWLGDNAFGPFLKKLGSS